MSPLDELLTSIDARRGGFIGGRWLAGSKGTSPVENPATGTNLAQVADGAPEDADRVPVAMIARKVAPALPAGCTVVIKPAAETPLSALAMGRLLHEGGVPDGVVNIVPGADAAAPLIITQEADVATAVEEAMIAKSRHGGLACTAANACYVHSAVVEESIERLGGRTQALSAGPADKGNDIDPLHSGHAVEDLTVLIGVAK